MKLSVIIVSWNVRDDVLACLESLYKNPPSRASEIIVVDNASTDGTVDAVKRDFPEVVTVTNSENRGFAAANNQGIEKSRGEYILFLNPDTIVHPNSLDVLVNLMDDNKDAGACGPKLLDSDGTTCLSVGWVPTFRAVLYGKTVFRPLGIFRGHYKKLRTDDFNYDKQTDVEQLSGAALMVRLSVIEEVGPMDESFFMYYEDADLCLRIRKAGWRIVYVPESVITHIGGKSSAQVSAKKRIMVYSSLLTYFRKHRGRFATGLFAFVFKPGVIVRDILNIFSGTISFIIFVLLFDQRKRLKSSEKIKNSIMFLGKYSSQFLFKI